MRGILACICLLLTCSPSFSHDFDGVTIIDVTESDAPALIGGKKNAYETHLVVFRSETGSYAALTSLRSSGACVAWAVQGSDTGNTIVFGHPQSEATRAVRPAICRPFKLSMVDDGTVLIEATTGVAQGADDDASGYSQPHRVIARVPLRPIDWSDPIFARHAVDGVRLGPVPLTLSALGDGVPPKIGALKDQPLAHKSFEARVEGPHGKTTVRAHIADAAGLGEPSDLLFAIWKGERIEVVTTDAFKDAVRERFGEAKIVLDGAAGETRLIWLHDLDGRALGPEDGATGNCLASPEPWLRAPMLASFNYDVGPWGCSLIAVLTHDGRDGRVTRYRIDVTSGYAMAINHFHSRIRMVDALRDKLTELAARSSDVRL